MNFASLEFFLFLTLVYTLYRLLTKPWQNWLLLIASYYFYAAWDWRFLSLILLSTLIDYTLGKSLYHQQNPKTRKQLLLCSLTANLSFLAFFKYFNFFTDSFTTLLTTLGLPPDWPTLTILLPVGISFYTFQTLSYTIDIYRRKLDPVDNLRDFALFVAFFPQLVAGPIERASHFLPQVTTPRTITLNQTNRGLFLILFGLFKKVAIADGISPAINAIYNTPGTVGTLDIILATYLFAIQIYCDFSAYTDIARGVAKLLGFDLMVNFKTPYFAINPSDFWRRWHISLSTWLRDYLYIPLGGNRNGTVQTYRNLMLTMALGGLWHGAAWNFVLWGIYQGSILCIHRAISSAKATIKPALTQPISAVKANSVKTNAVKTWSDHIKKALLILAFFHITCYGWLLFRAASWSQIATFTDRLFFNPIWSAPTIPKLPLAAMAGIGILILTDLFQYLTDTATFYRRWAIPIKTALYALLTLVTLMGLANSSSSFIYFQF